MLAHTREKIFHALILFINELSLTIYKTRLRGFDFARKVVWLAEPRFREVSELHARSTNHESRCTKSKMAAARENEILPATRARCFYARLRVRN